jgi:hypothetical protein
MVGFQVSSCKEPELPICRHESRNPYRKCLVLQSSNIENTDLSFHDTGMACFSWTQARCCYSPTSHSAPNGQTMYRCFAKNGHRDHAEVTDSEACCDHNRVSRKEEYLKAKVQGLLRLT